MDVLIPGRHSSPTYELSVVVYQAHRDARAGFCARCGHRAPCVARRHAASVIAAAGEDPRRHDAPLSSASQVGAPGQRTAPKDSTEVFPHTIGYPTDGRGPRPVDGGGYRYQRDTR